MATSRSPRAQHYIDCEECGENPAQFLCKSCPGHLRETCKTKHKTRKISKSHEVIHLHRNVEGTLGVLYCEKHTKNKLEWYCSPCKVPVCAECHIGPHNGHEMRDLNRVYDEIRKKRKEENDQIEEVLLPKFNKLLSEEKTKKTEILNKVNDADKKMKERIRELQEEIDKLQEYKKNAVKILEENESKLDATIKTLEKINEEITKQLSVKPGIAFFENTSYNLSRYTHTDFQPDIIITKL
ncbi:E3 ubiquitin-protein ligase TRIM71-like [Saccostrea cucullata]|uniref:E3 ubiquitin-protein ligase TRIM71-like n=1 Tax=Saccostrea cuccullata TaxID=36930 RepID=UPI002ED64C9A